EVSARAAAGAFDLHVLCHTTPAARLRHYLRACGLPEVLPEWGYGHWKSRDVYTHQVDVEDDFEGYRRHALPLDAIVIDSPWETQYNTWVFNPHQFPDAPGLVARMRVDGIKADGGEGFYLPDDADFHDGRTGAQAAWGQVNGYHRTMREALEEVHPGRGVLFSRSGWTGAQGIGLTWGGDQASDFWSLRALVAATLSAAASGVSNWSHDVGGYLGVRLVDR